MQRIYNPTKIKFLLLAIPFLISVSLALLIAGRSGYNVHPDEYAHIDAICYFESHWWPPSLNSDGILYSGYGWSRLYDGEAVYLVFGKLYYFIQQVRNTEIIDDQHLRLLGGNPRSGISWSLFSPLVVRSYFCGDQSTRLLPYRLFNVALYLLTLLSLAFFGRKHPWPILFAMVLICIPQVVYIYSYVNSDAWGLSASIFLFVFITIRREQLFKSWKEPIILAVLTSLVILSKKTFWITIPFAFLLIGIDLITKPEQYNNLKAKKIVAWFLLALLGTLVLIAPLKIIYPLSQGNFEEKVIQMREDRATLEYKPSHPKAPNYLLSSRGFTFRSVTNLNWLKLSAASFYGLFGYMSVHLTKSLYFIFYSSTILLTLLTLGILVFDWDHWQKAEKLMISIAPAFIVLPIVFSLYNSWTFDFQPQGRYLFASIIPLALLVGGLISWEPAWLRWLRGLAWLVLFLLCCAILWIFILSNPTLTPP